jgi:23S rRNA (guanosine2251-2'-O)-methyltransferase
MQIFGFHAVMSRIRRSPATVLELYLDEARTDPRAKDVIKLCKELSLHVMQVPSARLDKMCPGRKHQGVVAKVEESATKLSLPDLLDEWRGKPSLILVLDGVTDPRNLGACMRAADGAGAQAVIAPKDHACALTEIAIQTSSGAADSLPYLMVTNLGRALDDLQEAGIWCYGAADEADKTIYDLELPSSVAWVLGAEGSGLRRLTRERCDELVKIPMLGSVSSLNVSVATGVVMYETVRQRMLSPARS